MNNKILISYFSASGVTRRVAEEIKNCVDGDLFEIIPVNKYKEEDLDWTNSESRSSIEMNDKDSRPEILEKVDNISIYDKVIIGFPVWWYKAPTIINTFIEENDFAGEKIYIFVTSGSSGVDSSFNSLKEKYKNLNFIRGIRLTGTEDENTILEWLK